MPMTLDKADAFTQEMLDEVMDQYHGGLRDLEVRVGLLMVSDPEDSGRPILKLHGYPAAATIKVNSLEQRAQGMPDCTIKIDRATWDRLNEAQRRATLDHELYHIDIQHDDEGMPRYDDQGRPKIKLRLHDLVVGGFAAIIRRHGAAALESTAIEVVRETLAQLELPFGGEPPLGKAGLDDAEAEAERMAEQSAVLSPGTVQVFGNTFAAPKRRRGVVAKNAPGATISIDGGEPIDLDDPEVEDKLLDEMKRGRMPLAVANQADQMAAALDVEPSTIHAAIADAFATPAGA
jgi:hypothetical protein